MNVHQFTMGLLMKGVELTPVNDKLRIDAPPGVLTDSDRDLIREHRDDIYQIRERSILVRQKLSTALSEASKSNRYDIASNTAEAAEAEAVLETAMNQFVLGDGSMEDIQTAFRAWLKTVEVKSDSVGKSRTREPELFSL